MMLSVIGQPVPFLLGAQEAKSSEATNAINAAWIIFFIQKFYWKFQLLCRKDTSCKYLTGLSLTAISPKSPAVGFILYGALHQSFQACGKHCPLPPVMLQASRL
jgi:hypothetical protein